MSAGASGPRASRVTVSESSAAAVTSSMTSAGTGRLVSTHVTGEPVSRPGRTRSANRVSRSAQCASSIAITSGARLAASSSIPLIRSTSHSCWS
jgi:hypothetical protein